MLEKLKADKNKIIMLGFMAAVVVGRGFITLFNKGTPSAEGMLFCALMCITFVAMLFWDFPVSKEELFTGKNIIRIVSILFIFLWSFSEYYLKVDYSTAIFAIMVTVLCASDIRFMPMNVIIALGVTSRYITFGLAPAFCTVLVSLVLVAPRIKTAKTWEKLVFAAVQICMVVNIVYVFYKMRFMFSLKSMLNNTATTLVMILLVAFFILCAVLSLEPQKTNTKSKKKAKKRSDNTVQVAKNRTIEAFGYFIAVVFALVWTMLEKKFVMSGLVGLLLSTFIICRDGTAVQKISDKAASGLESLVDKFIPDRSNADISE